MHLRGVLVQAGGELVLGFLDGHAVDMVDLLANLVIAPAMAAPGERVVIAPRRSGGRPAQVAGSPPRELAARGRAGAASSRFLTITQRT